MTQTDWQVYFETLAAQHTALQHTSREKHFFRCELDEFFGDLRSKVRFPALIMESTLLDIYGDTFSRQRRRTLALIVVKNHVHDNWDEIAAALADCETIGTDIVGRLERDITSDAVPSLSDCSLEDIHAEPIANTPMKYVGWRFEFVVSEPACLDNKNHWHHD